MSFWQTLTAPPVGDDTGWFGLNSNATTLLVIAAGLLLLWGRK